MAADPLAISRLTQDARVGAMIGAARAIGLRTLLFEAMTGPVFTTTSAVLDYLSAASSYGQIESLRVLYLDTAQRLISDEVAGTGTIDTTSVYPRELLRRAIDLGAAGMILVHNHPSGDPTPSRSDIIATRQIQSAGKGLEIRLIDHLIFSPAGVISLRHENLI